MNEARSAMAGLLTSELDADILERLQTYAWRFRRLFPRSDQFRQGGIYLHGLLLDGERKSIQPLSQRVPGGDVQRLHQFVSQSPWDAAPVLREYRAGMAEVFAGADGVIVIDDTGFAKKGRHSIGVTRQYSGTLGKIGNCQVAVSLHYAKGETDYPLALRLYLPEGWVDDPERLTTARVPAADCQFKPKWQIALELLDTVREEGLPHAVVVADAGYGVVGPFRAGLESRQERYIVGLSGAESVCAEPPRWIRPDPAPTRGRPRSRAYLAADAPRPRAVADLAAGLQPTLVRWRVGTKRNQPLEGQFAWVRVWLAHDWQKGVRVQDLAPAEETARWLLVEWRPGGIIRYAFSNLPADTRIEQAVYWWKERWQVEQGYRQLKRELGLDHFEGRNWNGFHHHAAMTFLAYGFLALERQRTNATAMAAPLEMAEPLGGAWRDVRACPPCAAPFSSSSLHPVDSLAGHANVTC